MLSELEWEYVKELVEILSPFNKYSKELQSKSVTMSDFFGYWTSFRIKMSKRVDELSKSLLAGMNVYRQRLIDNPVLAAAVFLDPRYQRALKGDNDAAINFLLMLNERIRQVESFEVVEISECEAIEENNEEYEECL